MTEMMMTRRGLLVGAGALVATGTLAACNNGIGSNGASQIEARVTATQDYLFNQYPGTRDLAAPFGGGAVHAPDDRGWRGVWRGIRARCACGSRG